MFQQLLQQQTKLFQPLKLIYKMGGISALSEPSRDTESIQDLAQHDFKVSMQDVYLQDGTKLPGKRTATNNTTGKLLGAGVVSNNYMPCQPNDLYGIADHLLSLDSDMTITDVVNMPNMIGLQINKGSWSPTGELADTLQDNILLLTTFDGSKSTCMRTVSFRPICSNQYGCSKKLFSIRHTKNSDYRINELKSLLTLVTQEIEQTNKDIQSLVHLAMSSGQATDWFNKLLLNGKDKDDFSPRSLTSHMNKLSDFERLLHTGAGCYAGKDTRYAAFNALTNYCTHERTTRVAANNNESATRWESNLFGSAANFANTGFNQLVNN